MINNPLFDKEFLYELDQNHHKEIFARVIALTFDEMPIEQIEGRVTAGSVNIDGTSAVRRSCSLSLIAKELNINDFYWGLTNKFKLEIGVKNNINPKYPEIIWFNQGIYVITSFNASLGTNNYTVSINGKDKMCLLNGEIGGSLPAPIDFGKITSYDKIYNPTTFDSEYEYKAHTYYIKNPNYVNSKVDEEYILSDDEYNKETTYYTYEPMSNLESLPLYTIIRESVHTYAKEPYSNIIINDLDSHGLELIEYRGDKDLYLMYREGEDDAGLCTNMTTDGNHKCYVVTHCLPAFKEYKAAYERDLAAADAYYKEHQNESNVLVVYQNMQKQARQACINGIKSIAIEHTLNDGTLVFNSAVDGFNEARDKFVILEDNDFTLFSAIRIEYGMVAGYKETELTYAGDLISNAGETLVSILDKIKNMLGDFEYFYDVDGHFVFQRKKTYINTSWNTITKITSGKTTDDIYVENAAGLSADVYSFEDNNLITAFQNSPQLNQLGNDFSVWGQRKTTSGQEIPIHARFAIHKKPTYYKSLNGTIYSTDKFETYEEWVTRIQEEVREDVQHKREDVLINYNKKMNPIGLPEDWWEVHDWAEYFKLLTGEYPDASMDTYRAGGYTYFNVEAIFPPAPGASNSYTWKDWEHKQIFLFDVNADGTLGFTGHNPWCGHQYYSYFVNRDITAYIYKPTIPQAVFDQSFEDQVQEELDKIMVSEPEYYLKYRGSQDWREIIYQMAKDYFKHNEEDDFLAKVQRNNTIIALDENGEKYMKQLYLNGVTGYETYYTDMESFWRQLYNPDAYTEYSGSGGYYTSRKQDVDTNLGTYKMVKHWIPYETNYEDGYCDYFLPFDETFYNTLSPLRQAKYKQTHSNTYTWWNLNVVYAPQLLNFWLEFFDDAGDLSKFAIPVIGDRPKVVNDNDVTAIYFRETPMMIYTTRENCPSPTERKTGYTYVWISQTMNNLFVISSQGKSAKDRIDEMVYNYACCVENVSITTLPVYYLVPNTRIFIHDDESQINGEYIINKLTVPLTYNGTMSITASKAVDRLY